MIGHSYDEWYGKTWMVKLMNCLTGWDFEVRWILRFDGKSGWGKYISHCLKLIKIMLETWNLICNYKETCSFRKITR